MDFDSRLILTYSGDGSCPARLSDKLCWFECGDSKNDFKIPIETGVDSNDYF